jgi:hypothetical protein
VSDAANTGQFGASTVDRNLKTVAQFAAESPFTAGQVRWWIFNSSANGLDAWQAVVRIGRRVYLDATAFDKWVDAQHAKERPA